MNLFFKRLFGGLTPTEKYEREDEELQLAYKRYCDIQASEMLKEYTVLFHLVNSAEFKEKKKTLQNRRFKDTEEYRIVRRYEKMSMSKKIRSYYELLNSDQLRKFEEFKNSSDYEKLGNAKAVAADSQLQQFKAFEKSKEYKNYIGLHGSSAIAEYERAKEKMQDPEFIKSKEWWADKKRWQKTEEYKQEQRYFELKNSEDIRFYEETDPKRLEERNKWELTFIDKFEGNILNPQWKQGHFHRAKTLPTIYSFAKEKQVYTDCKNVIVSNNTLQIRTISEQAKGLFWDTKKGFFEKTANFTSGAINSGDSFMQHYGKISAKIKVCGSGVSHAFWLGTDGKLPHINIFSYNGKQISVGIAVKIGEHIEKIREQIKGISASNYYIYSLQWSPKELIWSINNVEVLRTEKNIPSSKLFLAFNSFISETNKGGNASFDVKWVKVYHPKIKIAE